MISRHQVLFPREDPAPRNAGTVEADADTATRRLVSHLRYLQYGQRSVGEACVDRWLFSATRNQVARPAAVAQIIGNGGAPVIWHKLILTPHQAGIADYRAWTRQQMRSLPFPAGYRRCWVGIVHWHPTLHIHVVLAGEHAAPGLSVARGAGTLLFLPPRAQKEAR